MYEEAMHSVLPMPTRQDGGNYSALRVPHPFGAALSGVQICSRQICEPGLWVLIRPTSTNKKATLLGGLCIGGDGGNRTRVRKSSAFGSTCLVHLLI